MWETLASLLDIPWVLAAVIVVGSIVGAYVIQAVLARTVLVVVRKTATELDDALVDLLRSPVLVSVILGGIAAATAVLARSSGTGRALVSPAVGFMIYGALKTLAVVIWVVAAMRIGGVVLRSLSRRATPGVVQPRTLPVFDIVAKLVVLGLGIYFFLVAWEINASGWLASAGVVGIIVGLAAKDTLGNLFAGLFILADAPYKLGDFIILDGNLRGRVTDIGIRSTRILTRDDIEITVPNSLIGNSKIINETAGPDKTRHRIQVAAAYGSDVDRVREVLLECWKGAPHICRDPDPRVRFRQFGDSGLLFELLIWIDDPMRRGEVLDDLNVRVYKAFNQAGIEIPYSKHDVYIKQMAAPRGQR